MRSIKLLRIKITIIDDKYLQVFKINTKKLKQKRTIEKPFPIKNKKDGQKKTYERKSFKEKQAIKSLALEFLQNGSGQKIFKQLQNTN